MAFITIKRTRIILFSCCVLICIMFGCLSNFKKTDKDFSFENEKELIATLDSLFVELNKIETKNHDYKAIESIVSINEKIRRVIENIQSKEILKALEIEYGKSHHAFTFVISPDRNVGIFSWFTRMDASGNAIKNIALHLSKDKIIPTSLYGEPIMYRKIYQVDSNTGQTMYLVYGNIDNPSSSFQRLNSYILRDGHLEVYYSFPNRESHISTRLAKENNLPNHFEVLENGLKINFRDPLDTSSVHQSLFFNGDKFVNNTFED